MAFNLSSPIFILFVLIDNEELNLSPDLISRDALFKNLDPPKYPPM